MIVYLILNLYIFCQVNDDNENTVFEFVWVFLTESRRHFAGGFQRSGILSATLHQRTTTSVSLLIALLLLALLPDFY